MGVATARARGAWRSRRGRGQRRAARAVSTAARSTVRARPPCGAVGDIRRSTDRENVQPFLEDAAHYPGGDNADEIADVMAGSSAAKAGLAAGMKLVAVNGRKWTPDILREAIRAAKDGKEPIELLVENDEFYQTVKIDWHGGERYPHLEKIAGAGDVLGEIAKMRAGAVK